MKRIKLLRWLNLLLVLITLGSYLSPYINPVDFWPASLLGLAYPWLLLLNLLFVAFWLASKKWHFLLSLGCILAWYGHFDGFVGLSLNQNTSDKAIKILTYNVNGLHYFLKKDNKIREDFFKYIKEENPDIFCLQETSRYAMNTWGWKDRLSKLFPDKPYYSTDGNYRIIFSKYPMKQQEDIKFEKSGNGFHYADLEIKGQIIRVYNVHLQSNKITQQADEIVEKKDFQDKKTWIEMKSIFGKMKYASEKRSYQAEEIAKHIQSSPYPAMVCGDFNATPLSYPYRILSNGKVDSFKEKGLGFGTTYSGAIPALRIDYVLGDPKFEFLSCEISKQPFSDHWPVVVSFELP